eukprot:scaffold1666_cov424-Prasinococcus_capsulatus_cf.AAC.13
MDYGGRTEIRWYIKSMREVFALYAVGLDPATARVHNGKLRSTAKCASAQQHVAKTATTTYHGRLETCWAADGAVRRGARSSAATSSQSAQSVNTPPPYGGSTDHRGTFRRWVGPWGGMSWSRRIIGVCPRLLATHMYGSPTDISARFADPSKYQSLRSAMPLTAALEMGIACAKETCPLPAPGS